MLYINNKPWITKSLLKCIHKKNKLYKKTIINSYFDMEYKNYKNCLNVILLNVKKIIILVN